MAFDEKLADRIREALRNVPDVRKQRMFRGLAFLGGKMACGIVGDELMLRLGKHRADDALDKPHVRPMDFTGRPMRKMVYVAQPDSPRQTRCAAGSTKRSHTRRRCHRKPASVKRTSAGGPTLHSTSDSSPASRPQAGARLGRPARTRRGRGHKPFQD